LLQPLLLAGAVALSAHAAKAQEGSHRRFAFATRAIARGAVLGADDIEYRDTTARVSADTNQVAAGWVTRRMIAAGEILRSPAVEPPIIVTANQGVEVEWMDDNVRLTVHGIAMRNGSLGDRVTVRTDQGRRIDATVVAPGRVRID
jgi:flagella basal body P-ring formation protein FlgA